MKSSKLIDYSADMCRSCSCKFHLEVDSRNMDPKRSISGFGCAIGLVQTFLDNHKAL